jgi:hypothetical protein
MDTASETPTTSCGPGERTKQNKECRLPPAHAKATHIPCCCQRATLDQPGRSTLPSMALTVKREGLGRNLLSSPGPGPRSASGFESHVPRHRERGLNRRGAGVPLGRWSGTARLHRGMSLAQTPPGLPLTRRSPRRGSLVGGSRRGSALPAKVRQAERRCPRERSTSRLPARRATRMPYRRVNHGTQRTTTVTFPTPMSCRLALYQHERIPRICLIRKRS